MMNIVVTTTEGKVQVSDVAEIFVSLHESLGHVQHITLRDASGSDIAFFAGHRFICWQKC